MTPELARQIIELLDGQQDYFREKDPEAKRMLLIQSKQREARLRAEANAVIDGEVKNLFSPETGGES